MLSPKVTNTIRFEQRPQVMSREEESSSARTLHVSGDSPVKRVAGAIAWIAREGECPRILATLPKATNTACKAIAIARNFLEQDKMDIGTYPRFSGSGNRGDDGFTFTLAKASIETVQDTRDLTEMKISKNSKPTTVAGAISARIRDRQRVCLACIGRECVTVAVRSIVIARGFLSQDSIDISFRPEFKDINFKDGRTSSSLQFHIYPQSI